MGAESIHSPHSSETEGDPYEEFEVPPTELEEDMFGMAVCSLIRDTHDIFVHHGNASSRQWRLLTTLLLLLFCIGTQVFLLTKIKEFVSAKAVHDIRKAYDKFESIMYSKTSQTVNGGHRGIDGFYDSKKFAQLSADEQSSACRIPLSQPDFCFVVLLIWTLTCCGELRQCRFLFLSLVYNTKTCDSMSKAMKVIEDPLEPRSEDFLVESLTIYMKGMIIVLVVLPRLAITLALIWLGCRWLLATNNFSDLILNAVALEFILCLKDALYATLMTRKNKLDLSTTKVLPSNPKQPAGLSVFVGAVLWMLLASLWVIIYMGIPHMQGLQTILPEYRWDVQNVCSSWISWRYCVASVCPKAPTRA